MSQPIIKVDNLGKSYLVGHQSGPSDRYTALRDVVGRTIKNFGRKSWDMLRGRQIVQGDSVEEFWALKDISLEIQQGEVIGIIGRNGAGKSTLLKILSRITEPTKGRVMLRGRVASLLEVGTGFHPELTGRENIFLNGAILGMARGEIKKKFDEIVDFAGVERFLDTPVKRYSSGMYVRLAFAVAAHLEPEILVIDEVLAVGDAEFQKKCLGKMQDVATGGRTVVFVSHQLGSVRSLCERAAWLDQGTLVQEGDVDEVVDSYLSNSRQNIAQIDSEHLAASSIDGFEFNNVIMKPESGTINTGGSLEILIHYTTNLELQSPAFVLQFYNTAGSELLRLSSMPISGYRIKRLFNEGSIRLSIPSLPFVPGHYSVDIGLVEERIRWLTKCSNAVGFVVEEHDYYNAGYCVSSNQGTIVTDHQWEHANSHAR